jgi:hypothetical protein
VRGLRVEADRVSFYINSVDGVAAIRLNRGQPSEKTAPILKKLKKKSLFLRSFLAKLKHIHWQSHYIQCGEDFFSKKHGEEVCI